MQPGSVIVDLAAETGGNCDLTEPDQIVERHGVTIDGRAQPPEQDAVPREPPVCEQRRQPAHCTWRPRAS